ncbi:phenylalanine-tRNA ligase subunit beta [Blattabacterium sp. (Blattella germanica) str. Bge]|uniref:phenylalanine--tRNA ligase subunit beta n=1 Tax=Blattabacterium sp. (Blattella germanica) TaxID=624186 RepID=UPI0001BB62D1|nr:phenylalanine--tRNA ligase subunit beta [Blattabacterium sp. (Blattella germanica)]ACY40081.1 phenylalanine-tRNA ligase subunit beta [Blattabacterium sp. (Blattella germanica) str. Bge]
MAKKYISININVETLSCILTDIGLPVKSIIKKIFDEVEDSILDVEVTPNRTDAMSHYGIARDLYAILKFRGYTVNLSKPTIINDNFSHHNSHIQILVQENKKCIRYSGMSIYKIKIEPSPHWLVSRLKSIGINSINNITDVINFVMYELGQPIHVFDMDQIEGKKIIIKNAEKNTYLKSSDSITRKLDEDDLIICDINKPLSLSGIINSIQSDIHANTKNIFLGSAYFSPIFIRSIGKKHFLKTESQYLFERGTDPNQTVYALQRTAFLIKNITKIKTYSHITDIYPSPISYSMIHLRYQKIRNILGKKISKKKIKKILSLLEIVIHAENDKYLFVGVPPYRIDVNREIDLIEEILRINGINKIKISDQIKISPLPNFCYKTEYKIQKILFEQLVCYGFQEIISSTMRNENQYSTLFNSFFNREEIKILNPINQNYKFMRSSLLFGMIDCIEFNCKKINYDNSNIKFFEIGKIYYKQNNKFLEKTYLGIAILQKIEKKYIDFKPFFYLKGIVEQIFQKSGICNYTQIYSKHPLLENSISILYNNRNLVELGKFKNNILRKKEIFYAEIDWEYLISIIQQKKITYIPFSKYPTSRRDLSLLVDKTISFEKINQLIKKKESHIIRKIKIYDFYESENLPQSKKSYTISFFFESQKETLTEKIINNSMKKIEFFLKKELKAEIREKK